MNRQQMDQMREFIVRDGEATRKKNEEVLQHDVEWLIRDIASLKIDEMHDLRMVASMLISHMTGSLVGNIIREYGELQAVDKYMAIVRFLGQEVEE